MVNATKTYSFFVVIEYAHECLFESTLLPLILLQNQIIFSF